MDRTPQTDSVFRLPNEDRAAIMRTVAAWLDDHPDLPAAQVFIGDHGVTLFPLSTCYPSRQSEIHNLYALAAHVGADVTVTPTLRGGWDLTACWQIGPAQTPMKAIVYLSEIAAAVRPAAAVLAARTAT